MPGVQNKYSIDVINRFAIEDDDVEDEDAENIDPFEELKALNQKAEDAKNAPKPKVIKSYTYSILIFDLGSKKEGTTSEGCPSTSC